MEIRYRCSRCKKQVNAMLFRVPFKAKPGNVKKYNLRPYHYRLDCTKCRKYIKFIGEDELLGLGIDLDSIETKKRMPKRKKIVSENKGVTNEELNFKLDIIIQYLLDNDYRALLEVSQNKKDRKIIPIL